MRRRRQNGATNQRMANEPIGKSMIATEHCTSLSSEMNSVALNSFVIRLYLTLFHSQPENTQTHTYRVMEKDLVTADVPVANWVSD